MRRSLALAMLVAGILVGGARADVYDIVSFGAVPNDAGDDAWALRLAYSAAAANGGGIIYIPAGEWRFLSADVIDGTAVDAAVVIRHRGIRIEGDARGWSDGANHGSVVLVGNCLSGFKIARTYEQVGDVYVEQLPQGVTIEHLEIRSVSTCEPGAWGDAAIEIDDLHASASAPAFIRGVLVDDVRCEQFAFGLVTRRRSTNQVARALELHLRSSEFSQNSLDGVRLSDFGGVRMSDIQCASNGRDGLSAACNVLFWGTLNVSGCGFFGNARHGVSLSGTSGQIPIQDIHIATSQFDLNGDSGVFVDRARNVNLSSSSVTGNDCANTSHALQIVDSSSIAVAAITVLGNDLGAILIDNCDSVSLAGINLVDNNKAQTNPPPAWISILGGHSISIASATFRTGSAATAYRLGIGYDESPNRVTMSGLAFDAGFLSANEIVKGSTNGSAFVYAERLMQGTTKVQLSDGTSVVARLQVLNPD